jgi:hypothetical protein
VLRAPRHSSRRCVMTDFIYVVVVMAGTFIVGGLYTVLCGKL